MMLDTNGVAGVPINNGRAYSNRFGLAVISDITSYYNTDTRIDVNKLADDVEATRAVVQGTLTEGVAGVPVRGYGSTVLTNRYGKAVVADVNSYYRNKASIDLNSLSDNVEATRSVAQATLTEGAIGYRKFEVIAGEKAMAIVKLADGSEPPFGATVLSATGREIAVVNDGGSVYLTGVQPEERLDVAWEGRRQCRIGIPGAVKPLDRLLLPCAKP